MGVRAATGSMWLPLTILLCALRAGAGTTEQGTLNSALVGTEVEYRVFLPSDYYQEAGTGKRYPVVYLLHCAGCRAWDWADDYYGPVVDKLIDSVDFIAVAPDDGNTLRWWLDSPVQSSSQWSTLLVDELKPRIDSLYNTCPGHANTGVAGHSMGGFGALHNLIEHPRTFSAAFSMKGAVDLMPYAGNWGLSEVLGEQSTHPGNWRAVNVVDHACELAGKDVSIAFYSGLNDWFYEDNRKLHRILDSCGITHQWIQNDEPHFRIPSGSMQTVLSFFDSVFVSCPPSSVDQRHGTARPADLIPQTLYRRLTDVLVNVHGRRVKRAQIPARGMSVLVAYSPEYGGRMVVGLE